MPIFVSARKNRDVQLLLINQTKYNQGYVINFEKFFKILSKKLFVKKIRSSDYIIIRILIRILLFFKVN